MKAAGLGIAVFTVVNLGLYLFYSLYETTIFWVIYYQFEHVPLFKYMFHWFRNLSMAQFIFFSTQLNAYGVAGGMVLKWLLPSTFFYAFFGYAFGRLFDHVTKAAKSLIVLLLISVLLLWGGISYLTALYFESHFPEFFPYLF